MLNCRNKELIARMIRHMEAVVEARSCLDYDLAIEIDDEIFSRIAKPGDMVIKLKVFLEEKSEEK